MFALRWNIDFKFFEIDRSNFGDVEAYHASTPPSIRPADLEEYEIYIPPRCENNYFLSLFFVHVELITFKIRIKESTRPLYQKQTNKQTNKQTYPIYARRAA